MKLSKTGKDHNKVKHKKNLAKLKPIFGITIMG